MPLDPEVPALAISEVPDTPASGGGASPGAPPPVPLAPQEGKAPPPPPLPKVPAAPPEAPHPRAKVEPEAPKEPELSPQEAFEKLCTERAGTMIAQGLSWCSPCGKEQVRHDMGHRACPDCPKAKQAAAA